MRNRTNVNADLQEIYNESNNSAQNNKGISLFQLFTLKELRWPLITSLVLQIAQQLCGINAVRIFLHVIFS